MQSQDSGRRHDPSVANSRARFVRALLRTALALAAVSLLIGISNRASAPASASREEADVTSRIQGIRNDGWSGELFGHLIPDVTATYDATYTRHDSTRYTQFGGALGGVYAAPGFMPGMSRPPGIFALRTESDSPVATVTSLSFTSWPANSQSNQAMPGTDVVVSYVVKRVDGGTSLLAVQNADVDNPVDVRLELYATSGGTPVVTASRSIPPASGTLFDLRTDQDPQLRDLPCGYEGWARVVADTPIAVSTVVDIEGAPGLMAFEGVPASMASEVLHAPLVGTAKDLGYRFGSSLVVANPGKAPTEVEVTYRGLGGSCQGLTIRHGSGPHRIGAGSIAVFDQGPSAAASRAGASGLPEGCVATAEVSATGADVVGVVLINDTIGSFRLASAYNAAPPIDASTRHVTEYANEFSMYQEASYIVALNPNDSPSTASVTFDDRFGYQKIPCKAGACEQQIPARGAVVWWLPDVLSDTRDYDVRHGAAVVESDLPILVLHRKAEAARQPRWDPTAAYAMSTQLADGSLRGVPLHPLVLVDYTLPEPSRCNILLPFCADMWFLPRRPLTHP